MNEFPVMNSLDPVTPGLSMQHKVQKAKRSILSNYTSFKRAMDIADSIIASLLFAFTFKFYIHCFTYKHVMMRIIAFISSMLAADFLSGLIHWSADTWGTFETPIFGPTFIRSFREHHLAPTAMTKHDVFETNGDNCLATIPLLLYVLKQYQTYYHNDPMPEIISNFQDFKLSFIIWLAVWIALTNQIHAWSHMLKPPVFVRLLQSFRIILNPRAHHIHHIVPFNQNYCITNGWCDVLFSKFSFWRRLEALITRFTSLIPREDDMKWNGLVNEQPRQIQNYLLEKCLSPTDKP